MPKAREVKSRIGNVQNIKQITKAMNAIAMAKVTRMKERLEEGRPYRKEMQDLLARIRGALPEVESPLLEPDPNGKLGLLVLNSDRGLCGRYKEELNRTARDFIRSRDGKVELYAGGEKGQQYFRHWAQLEKSWVQFYDDPSYDQAVEIARYVSNRFKEGKLSQFWVIYMEFVSDLNQNLQVEKVLPFEPPEESQGPPLGSYVFEPPPPKIIRDLLTQSLEERIFSFLLETKTSEHAIRRKAMRDATENADELISDLTLQYNKARQQQITREIADIMGGAEALREEGT